MALVATTQPMPCVIWWPPNPAKSTNANSTASNSERTAINNLNPKPMTPENQASVDSFPLSAGGEGKGEVDLAARPERCSPLNIMLLNLILALATLVATEVT